MARYTYLTADLLTGTIREELPLTGVRWSKALNGPGALNANIRYTHPKCTRANLDPGKTAIYIRRNGLVVWGGILWTARKVKGNDVLQLGALGFWSYIRRRRLRHSFSFTNADQLAIFRDLVRYVQGDAMTSVDGGPLTIVQPNGSIGITYGSETSGVLRSKNVNGFEMYIAGQQCESLAGLQGGFDFAVELTEPTEGNFVKTLQLNYPRRGRRTNLVFEQGKNVKLLDWQIDADRLENRVDALGAGEGTTMLIQTAQDTNVLDQGYPLLDGVESQKGVTTTTTLAAHAEARLKQLRLPVSIPTLSLRVTEEGEVGSFIEGDECLVRADDGFVQFDNYFRIVNYLVDVSNEGDETIDVTFAESEAAV